MAQPALIVVPDDRTPRFFTGTINSVGRELWFFHNSNGFGRATTLEFGSIFPAPGSTFEFNGLMLVPSVESYVPPTSRSRAEAVATRSGVHLPARIATDYDWTIGKAEGLQPFVDEQGLFSSPVPTFKMFDRKCILRCLERQIVNGEEDIEGTLEAVRTNARTAPTARLWAVHGLCVYVVEVEFATREYPPPIAPPTSPPQIVDRDDGEDTRKRTRRKKQQED